MTDGNDPSSPFFGLHYADKPLPAPEIAVSDDGNAVVARHPTRETHDCMFHDEGIPDAPCICGTTGPPPEGSHDIVQGSVVSDRIDHRPQRTDQVEAWLKAKRDQFDKTDQYGRGLWHVMDSMLDEYRLAADMGMTLEEILKYEGPR